MAGRGRDAKLVERIAEGDTDAVAELYARYVSLLYAFALRVLRDPGRADDVVHDAFVLVMDRAAAPDPGHRSTGAWLVALVRSLGARHARLDRPSAPPVPDVTSSLPSSAEVLAAAFDDAAEGERFRRVFESLRATDRRILEAAFFDGVGYAEIGRRESLPHGTVRSRAARAIAALRAALPGASRGTSKRAGRIPRR